MVKREGERVENEELEGEDEREKEGRVKWIHSSEIARSRFSFKQGRSLPKK